MVDDEEDEAWKEWGRKKLPDVKFDPPPSDFTNVDVSAFQEEMMKRHTGPSFGFVNLQPGVRRSREEVPEMAMRWTNVLRSGAVEAKFIAVDVNTIMFTLERGQDTREKAISISPKMAQQVIQILKAENVEFVVAPYEADAQLAYLSNIEARDGGISAVITEDNDLLAYGCQTVQNHMASSHSQDADIGNKGRHPHSSDLPFTHKS